MIELNSFVCGDCMDYLLGFPDKYFELAIVDPPYGIHIEKSGRLKNTTQTMYGTINHLIKNISKNCSEYQKIKLYGAVIILDYQQRNAF